MCEQITSCSRLDSIIMVVPPSKDFLSSYQNPSCDFSACTPPLHLMTKKTQQQRRARQRELFLETVNTWLKPQSSPINVTLFDDILKCLKSALKAAGHTLTTSILHLTFLYASRFVANNGPLLRDQVLLVLMISAVIAVKFCVDSGDVDLALIGYVAGVSKQEMLTLERRFLRTLQYCLFVSAGELVCYTESLPQA